MQAQTRTAANFFSRLRRRLGSMVHAVMTVPCRYSLKSEHSVFLIYYAGKHTVFGRVSEGIKVLQRLGAVPVDGDDR